VSYTEQSIRVYTVSSKCVYVCVYINTAQTSLLAWLQTMYNTTVDVYTMLCILLTTDSQTRNLSKQQNNSVSFLHKTTTYYVTPVTT